jgi:hypothetical protein
MEVNDLGKLLKQEEVHTKKICDQTHSKYLVLLQKAGKQPKEVAKETEDNIRKILEQEEIQETQKDEELKKEDVLKSKVSIEESSMNELDGVGPVDNRPSTDKLHHLVRKKMNKKL